MNGKLHRRKSQRQRSRLDIHSLRLELLEARLALASDFGDAPAPFPTTTSDDGASHVASGATLGPTRDMESNGSPTPLANGDGADEDGVSFGPLRIGQPGTLDVNIQNTASNVRLDAWVDFNGDGNWGGAGEQILDSHLVSPGDTQLRFQIPSWSASGRTYARLRVSSTGDLGHGGAASNGEVEDYVVNISPAFGPGTFPFSEHQTLSSGADGAFGVFATDLDGDGDNDVLSASRNDDAIRWYENSGGGLFLPGSTHTITTTADNVRSVFAADIDGDGDMDVLSASAGDDTIAWYVNKLDEPFQIQWPKRVVSSTADSAREVFAADMDGDGDTDILGASAGDDTVAWYENNGSGTFTERTIATDMDGARTVVAADMDGDGDMDVVAGITIRPHGRLV